MVFQELLERARPFGEGEGYNGSCQAPLALYICSQRRATLLGRCLLGESTEMDPASWTLSAACIVFIMVEVACCWLRCFFADCMPCLNAASALEPRPRVCSRFAGRTRGPESNDGRATGRDELNSHGRVRKVAAMVSADGCTGTDTWAAARSGSSSLGRGPATGSSGEVSRRAWMVRKPRAASYYEVVVWLPTIMRLVPQHSLRSPSALVADFLVDALRPIGISPRSAGHDAACLQQNFGGCQSAHAISRGMGPAAEHPG